MAGDEGIFATTAEVQAKAGANASSVSNVEAYINDYVAQAEALINATMTFNFSDSYTTLNTDVAEILKMAASAKAAMMVINFDMSGFTSRQEAINMLNVLRDEYNLAITELKLKDTQEFIKNA